VPELVERLTGHTDGATDPHRPDLPALDQLVRLVDADTQFTGDLLDLEHLLSAVVRHVHTSRIRWSYADPRRSGGQVQAMS
jgi:hypothetical protein